MDVHNEKRSYFESNHTSSNFDDYRFYCLSYSDTPAAYQPLVSKCYFRHNPNRRSYLAVRGLWLSHWVEVSVTPILVDLIAFGVSVVFILMVAWMIVFWQGVGF